MTIQIFVPLLLAFFVGCIFTEIRWIGRMRRLRGKLSLVEAARKDPGENARSGAAAVARTLENTRESLLSLQQTLTAETTPASVAETSEISKS
jgi:hypothetical protein